MELRTVCANGVPLIANTNPCQHGFCIGIYILTGSMYESKKDNGITHLFEHCVFRNLKKRFRRDLYELLTENGISFNASTYKEFLSFDISGIPKGLPFAAELIRAMFLPLDLTGEEFQTEKRRIKAEIREDSEKTEVRYLLGSKVWQGTALEQTIAGSCGNLDRISRKRLEEFRQSILVPENMLVYLTGSIDDDAKGTIERAVTSIPTVAGEIRDNTAPVPHRFGNRELLIHTRASDYDYLAMGFDIDNALCPVGVRDLIHGILFEGENALFYQRLSEQTALVYSYDATMEQYRNISNMHFRFEIRPEDIPSAVREVGNVFRMLREGEFSFENNLQKQLTKWELMQDDPAALNWSEAYENHILGAEPVNREAEHFGRFDGITKAQIMECAARLFRRENLTIAFRSSRRRFPAQEIEALLAELF